ncbi:MAG: oxidoreductase, molybdopterin-binding protein [Variovorax sp.]|nr:oxidoreductase, molybdopterin-binding protein [Variovorax sp.]
MKNPHSVPANLRRRAMLAGSASAAIAVVGCKGMAQTPPAAPVAAANGAKPLPAYVSWKDPSALIVHSAATVETKRSVFGSSVVTPTSQLYIRNNLPAPPVEITADRDAWEVNVEGVRNPRKLTVADLKAMGLDTVTMVLQCSGNGRGFFPSKPSGTAWKVGAAGCVVWSGVPVRDVVAALGGVTGGMAYMTSTGGEKIPEGIDPRTVMVERSVPVEAMADALLAWELNGEPIPVAHGGPLRVIVPGYAGVNNVKYVKRLAFTAEQSPAAIQQTGYRITPLGEKHKPSEPSVWEMAPKSWINSPLPEDGPLRKGGVVVQGVAFGGMHPAARVEVSTDGGASWKRARLIGPDMGRYAWRQFALNTTLPAGTHTLMSRVTDSTGRVQAETSAENAGGYSNSGWRAHGVQVTVA